MNIIELKERPGIQQHIKLHQAYLQLQTFLHELNKRSIPNNVAQPINATILNLNTIADATTGLKKAIHKAQSNIIKLVVKELKIVPRSYYRNMWFAVGMTAFGLPIGVIFGMSMGNIGLMAVGLPLGMLIGAIIGTSMDKKAAKEGRQLQTEIRY